VHRAVERGDTDIANVDISGINGVIGTRNITTPSVTHPTGE
jgi:hypothetical protein